MGDNTKIEWAKHPFTGKGATWNPITGCSLVSEGCRNCYAAQLAGTRLKNHPSRKGLARQNAAGEWKFTGAVRFNEQWIDQPLRWKAPRGIFVCAHGDLFHENVPDEWIDLVFAVMAMAPQHLFFVLTKRPERAREYLAPFDQRRANGLGSAVIALGYKGPLESLPWPLPNVWLGTSVEDQATADARIPHLLSTPAAKRFVSYEPALGPVDLTRLSMLNIFRIIRAVDSEDWPQNHYDALAGKSDIYPVHGAEPDWASLDWVIAGGESGHHARPAHPDWFRGARDQCAAAGVPFFFKQWGEWISIYDRDRDDPDWRNVPRAGDWGRKRALNFRGGQGFHGDKFHMMKRVGKQAAGHLLDGKEHFEMPATQEPSA